MASSEDGSADVFVSYSRSDQAFARELVTALSSREKTVWVDWEGIPPTAEWLAEIHTAIEESDAFLFVMSRASLASRVCREELEHAEKLGKRIVPIEFGAVDPGGLPPSLADRHWISFGDGVPFEQSIDVLVAALDTDLDWVREHTQWLQKAREWERRARERSFLLRGAELRAAESWLSTPGVAMSAAFLSTHGTPQPRPWTWQPGRSGAAASSCRAAEFPPPARTPSRPTGSFRLSLGSTLGRATRRLSAPEFVRTLPGLGRRSRATR